jgi:hypothetical protein
MQTVPSGIAQVSFAGGSAFVPARSPYDRELLVENVRDRVRLRARVQVLVSNERWLVCRAHGGGHCTACGGGTRENCYRAGIAEALCVHCAFGGRSRRRTRHSVPDGRASCSPAVAASAVNSRTAFGSTAA